MTAYSKIEIFDKLTRVTKETHFVCCESNDWGSARAALPRPLEDNEHLRGWDMAKADWLREVQWYSHINKAVLI